MATFSCVIIGEGNIALTCLRLLQENGFKIKAVFTNTSDLRSFCETSCIQTFPRRMRIENVIEAKSFDYLFSVNNPTILSREALVLAKILSINYHDSPLPSYAGVHATSWAIINGERKHGISWHVIEPGIDTGDILQSQTVEINDNDSAFSLNMTCLDAAIKAFRRLLLNIRVSKMQPSRQDFSKRSYYGLYETPPHLGILDLSQGQERTYNLVRSLEFGAHENRLGSPKIYTPNGKFLLVTSVEAHSDYNNYAPVSSNGIATISNASLRPGSVLACKDNVLVVATDSGVLSLTVAELDGRPLAAPGGLEKYAVKAGVQLTSLKENVNEAMNLLPRKEQFWRQKMKSYEPTTFVIQKLKVVAGALCPGNMDVKTVDIPLPNLELGLTESEGELGDLLVATFIAFLARTNCTSSVHVGIVAGNQGIDYTYHPLYADVCPGVFKLDLAAPAKDAISQCALALLRHREAKTFLLDMFYRYPELKQIKRTPHHNLVLGFESDHLSDQQRRSILSDSNILIEIGDGKVSVSYFKRPDSGHSHVEDLLRHFPTFLTSLMSDDTSMTLLDVNLISPTEAERLYKCPELAEDGQNNDVIGLFRKICVTKCEASAIKTTENKLTYGQLLEEVCSLSDLISSNLPQEYRTDLRCMALHMPSSVAYVVSVLASMMSHTPFMPVPEKTPPQRMSFTLNDARVTVMLTTYELFKSGKLNDVLSSQEVLFDVETSFGHLIMLQLETKEKCYITSQDSQGMAEVCSFTNLSDIDEEEDGDVQLEPDCCYVMYTSGSTGRPKGVQVKISGVYNMARAQIASWDIDQTDTIAQFASIGFDATISEIFTAVLSGACLAVLNEKERLGREFMDAMVTLQVTLITLPPSVLNIYGPSDFPTLKKVVTAGEACTFATAIRWTKGSDVRFFNAYGPTEATVCGTIYEYQARESTETPSMDLPIGGQIRGVQVYLFDDFLKPVPPGVVGEIYIGGRGVSAGYIGHANSKNDERFIKNPLGSDDTLYKTGDHAIQDNDGCLTYIGRLDDQVKIRGQRVDLNEIEQAMLSHPDVDMAVVVKHQSKKCPVASIAAFLAPVSVNSSELREYLLRILPCYMMPTYMKRMDVKDFPLTINGKIDRKKLERDQSVVEQSSSADSCDLTDAQKAMAKLWCRVLQIDESNAFSLHRLSTFSELGGNSLHMVLLQRAIEDGFGIRLSFAEIGRASSIQDFVALVDLRQDSQKKCGDHCEEPDISQQLIKDSILNMKRLPDVAANQNEDAHQRKLQNILLSGATGFLGAFLLYEIFQQSKSAHVYCMVRETSEKAGLGRIVQNLKKYKIWDEKFKCRISVVLSDLSKPKMGLRPNVFTSLSTKIDVIFMNAAKMNFNEDYDEHKIANVDSTYEFLKLAFTGKRKFVFCTSSLAVFLFPRPIQEKEEESTPNHISIGSKGQNLNMVENEQLVTTDNESNSLFRKQRNVNGSALISQENRMKMKLREMSDILIGNGHSNGFTNKSEFLDISKTDKLNGNSNGPKSLQYSHFDSALKDNNTIHSSLTNGDAHSQKEDDLIIPAKKERVRRRKVIEEVEDNLDPSHIEGGYDQSKWVSERLVFQALDYLPGGAVFRPARVTGHSVTGVGPTNDLFAVIARGMPRLGYTPDLDIPFDLSPVDFCAKAMIEITLQKCRDVNGAMPRAYHLANPSTINFLDMFDESAVKRLPLDEWREKLRKADSSNPLVPLTPFFVSSFWDRATEWPFFSTKNTDRFVSPECQKLHLTTKDLLEIYRKYFVENGLL